MSKFMIVRFDRYNGQDSDHEVVEAKDHNEAYAKYMTDLLQNEQDEEEIKETIKENPLKGTGELRCNDNEEESILVIIIH